MKQELFFEKCKYTCLQNLSHRVIETKINLFTVRQCVIRKDPFMLGSSGAYFRENLNDLTGEINICVDLPAYRNRFFRDNSIERQEVFLRSLNIVVDKHSIFLMVLLHELGHSNIIKNFQDIGRINDYIKLKQNISDFCIDNKYDNENIDNHLTEEKLGYMSAEYYINVIEARADLFAIECFLPIWNAVSKYIK